VKITKTTLKQMIKEELSALSEKNLEESGYIGNEMPPQQALQHLNRLFHNGKISVNDLADHFGRPMHGVNSDSVALVIKDNVEILKELSSALTKIRQDYAANLSKTVGAYLGIQRQINEKHSAETQQSDKWAQKRAAKRELPK